MTGTSYVVGGEAFVTVNQYDIQLYIKLVNRSSEHLRNVTVEMGAMGDLKVVDKPQPLALGPGEKKMVRVNVKVSSTLTLTLTLTV